MKHPKKARLVISAAVLTGIAMATVACSRMPSGGSAADGSGAVAQGGNLADTSGSQNSGQSEATKIAGLLSTGSAQASRKDWSGATATFQDVLAISPGNVYANYDLGVVAQNTGNSAEAISYYKQALAGNAAYTPAMYNEAILLERAQPQLAIGIYQKIVSINPKAATAYLRMAFLQAEQGDLIDAKANDAKAVALDSALGKYSLPVKQ
jgi:tetratricopeptide (TPR) repeat protein